jgi:hypothetical protein
MHGRKKNRMWPLSEHFTPQLAVAALLASGVHAIAHGDEFGLAASNPSFFTQLKTVCATGGPVFFLPSALGTS